MTKEVFYSPGKKYFNLNLKYLFITGLWSNDEWTKSQKFMYQCFENLLHVFSIMCVTCATCGTHRVIHDFAALMENLVKTLVGYNYFLKTVFFVANRKKLRMLIADIIISGDKITKRRNKMMTLLVASVTLFTMIIIISFSIFALIDGEMPVEIVLPFNPNKNLFTLLLGHQCAAAMYVTLQLRAIAMQGIVSSLMMYMCDQLLELQLRIKSLKYTLERDQEIRNAFKDIIKKHVRLIK